MTSSSNQGSSIPPWFYFITWLLVVFGWIIVNWQNNRREERKELRAAITSLTEEIVAFEALGKKFHQASKRSEKKASQILAMERSISEHFGYLGIRRAAYNRNLTLLIDSITLENFDVSNFEPKTKGDELIQRISDTSFDLQSSLEREYSSLFRRGWLRSFFTRLKHIQEEGKFLGPLFRVLTKHQDAIFGIFAYLFLLGFLGYALSLVPRHP